MPGCEPELWPRRAAIVATLKVTKLAADSTSEGDSVPTVAAAMITQALIIDGYRLAAREMSRDSSDLEPGGD